VLINFFVDLRVEMALKHQSKIFWRNFYHQAYEAAEDGKNN